MRTPLAEPPGRRGWFVRMGPAWWASAAYAVFAAAYLIDLTWGGNRRDGGDLVTAMFYAWPTAATVLFVGAIVSGALALAQERSRGTADALLMTPIDHAKLVRGRYWLLLAPWLRFLAYTLPLYAILSATRPFAEASEDSEWWVVSGACAFSCKPFCFFAAVVDGGFFRHDLNWTAWGSVLAIVRVANDLSIVVLAYSASFYISARARTTVQSLALACCAALALLTAFSPHDWWILVGRILLDRGTTNRLGLSDEAFFAIYVALGAGTFLARWLIAWWLCRSACRNFERWATDAGAG